VCPSSCRSSTRPNTSEQAITTILAQDYDGDKEVVLALGPSTDDTNTIIESMAAT
jgi:succinoglycan biosynthesis protein ExoA